MLIKRNYYLNQLINRKHNGLVKTICGLRRSGKSYLLFELFNQHLLESGVSPDHIIKIKLDELSAQPLLNNKKLFKYIQKQIISADQYYILIDEIQNVEGFEPLVIELSRKKNVDVYITGSNSRLLTSELDTILRGKDDPIHIYPLSFDEFCQTQVDKNEAFIEYCRYGGLPYLTYLKNINDKKDYLKRLLNETYVRDILEHHNIKNKSEISEVLKFLSSCVGSLVSSVNLSNTFLSNKNKRIKYSTIDRYIRYLESSFLINRVSRYDIKGKKLIGASQKYYFEDLGLRNALTEFNVHNFGHIVENIVFNELKLRGFDINVGNVVSRTVNKTTKKLEFKMNEIDFVVNHDSNACCIQVCASLGKKTDKTYQREIKPLINIDGKYKRIVITTDNIPKSYDENGILFINVIDFLLDKNSI